MLILFKILLIWFLFTSCEQAEETQAVAPSSSVLVGNMAPSKWKSLAQFPIQLKYGTGFTAEEVSAIENSTENWSQSTQNKIDFFDTSSSEHSELETLDDYDDNEFGIYKLLIWPLELPGTALAVTQIYGNRYNIGSSSEFIEINHADILINFQHFNFTTDDSWGYDLETVILHEMGHFLGLYHNMSSDNDSVMYPTISKYKTARDPKDYDVIEILNKYPGHDTLTTRALASVKQEQTPEAVTLILELYSDGHEVIRIKKESGNEIFRPIHVH